MGGMASAVKEDVMAGQKSTISISVGTTATLISAAGNRRLLRLVNTGSVRVYLSNDPTTLSTTVYQDYMDASDALTDGITSDALYGLVASGTATVKGFQVVP
jgi:hypothetical protein